MVVSYANNAVNLQRERRLKQTARGGKSLSSTAVITALAGLLHDIGKFWQRAESDKIHPDFRDFGKDDYGANGAHATFSAAFVQQVVPERWREAVMGGALWHHNPRDPQARLIALADRLAAGVDRTKAEVPSNPPQQLLSIFSRLGESTGRVFVPLRELALTEDALMPNPEALAKPQAAYAVLWASFRREAEGLANVESLDAYLEGMLALFQRFTWCIPSAYYGSDPDISLYDHSRTVAALAACLSTLDDDAISVLLTKTGDQPVVTFIEGDLSGIQRFLYTIPARGAAKQLRARSLYLQMLTDAAARWLLRHAGMPAVNLIYSGGGRFFALLPYVDDGDESLAEAQRTFDRLLLKHHDGDLYLSMGWAHLAAQDFTSPDRFSTCWHAVTAATGAVKRARYGQLPDDELFESVFEPRMQGEHDELWLRRSERDEIDEDQDAARGAASAFGQSLEALSRRLAQADYLLVSIVAPTPGPPAGYDAALRELGLEVQPVRSEEFGHQWRSGPPASEVDYALLQGLRRAPEERDLTFVRHQWSCPVVGALRFTVNVTPMLNEGHQPATFDDLQKAASGEGAIKRLGVLRMDVDDLGAIFAEGFRNPQTQTSRASLARVASLSFALSLFFEGWVGELCARINREVVVDIPSEEGGHVDRVEAVYAVYSGGDDLFIVGRWDVLPKLAYAIHSDLTRYAAGTDRLHLSAGITLHGGKYPLYQAAEEAREALDSAKAQEGKNAVCFLGRSLQWAQWDELTAVRDELHTLVSVNNAPRAILQSLLQLYDDYDHALRAATPNKAGEAQILWGPGSGAVPINLRAWPNAAMTTAMRSRRSTTGCGSRILTGSSPWVWRRAGSRRSSARSKRLGIRREHSEWDIADHISRAAHRPFRRSAMPTSAPSSQATRSPARS